MTRRKLLIGVCALCVGLPAGDAAQLPVDAVPSGIVAEKLGVTLMPNAPTEVELGRSITATLADPRKLVPLGIKGMHEGARVSITCIVPNRLRVEADEIEPVAQRAAVTVNVGPDGSLTPAPDRVPPPPKPSVS